MAQTMTSRDPQAGSGPFKAWHALLWFIGFFAFMFVVNGIFLWTAIRTFPGEDVDKSYLAGLDYNHEIARRALQAENAWTAEIGVEKSGTANRLRIRLLDANLAALPAADVVVQLRHPADRALDLQLAPERVASGEYAADLTGIHPGLWKVRITAETDAAHDGTDFLAERELIVP